MSKKRTNNGNAEQAPHDNAAAAEEAVKADAATEAEDTANAEKAEESNPHEQAELKASEQFDHSFLKALAAMENLRRRSEKQVSDAHKFALADFIPAIGDVRDCLETAINNNADDVEKLREGVALTLRKLVNAMDSRHILPIRPDVGAQFDPTIHMAIGMLPPTAQAPEKTVAAVVQAGYMLNGRIIRPANVMVSKQAENADAQPAAPEKTKKTEKTENKTATTDKADSETTETTQ